jgi:putative flippase GtrA
MRPRLRRVLSRLASLPAARRIGPSLGRFLAVGLSNTVLSYALFRGCLWAIPDFWAKAGTSQLLSYGAGICWSYVWNRRWTFRSQGPAGSEAARFVALQIGMALISSALVGLLVDGLGLWPTPSWIVVMGLVTLANYAGSRCWVFRSAPPPGSADAA